MTIKVYVIARDIQRHDAVGNFCRQAAAILTSNGFDAGLVAENCHPDDRSSIAQLPEFLAQIGQDDVVFFQYSTEDPALEVLADLDCAKVLFFHNITPERFFTGVDERTAQLVRLGLAQRPYAKNFDVLMANSSVSARDLRDGFGDAGRNGVAVSNIVACPPVVSINRWDGIISRASSRNVDSRTILYVGRMVPHKGITDLIDGFAALAAQDSSVRLLCVGGPADGSFQKILSETLDRCPAETAQRIEFEHGVSDGVLKWIYERVGVCVSMSHHEGFGVPLVDAMVFDKPIVISKDPGMRETVGDAAVIADDMTPQSISDALALALDDSSTRDRLASARQARLQTLHKLADGHLILDAIEQARVKHRARHF